MSVLKRVFFAFLFLFSLLVSLSYADLQDDVNHYTAVIMKQYNKGKTLGYTQDAVQYYKMAYKNLDSLYNTVKSWESFIKSKLNEDPNYEIPDFDFNFPFIRDERELRRRMEFLKTKCLELLNEYAKMTKAVYKADIIHINNTMKMVFRIFLMIKVPDLSDVADLPENMRMAKNMKEFMKSYRELQEKWRDLRIEWEKLKEELKVKLPIYNEWELLAAKQRYLYSLWQEIRERLIDYKNEISASQNKKKDQGLDDKEALEQLELQPVHITPKKEDAQKAQELLDSLYYVCRSSSNKYKDLAVSRLKKEQNSWVLSLDMDYSKAGIEELLRVAHSRASDEYIVKQSEIIKEKIAKIEDDKAQMLQKANAILNELHALDIYPDSVVSQAEKIFDLAIESLDYELSELPQVQINVNNMAQSAKSELDNRINEVKDFINKWQTVWNNAIEAMSTAISNFDKAKVKNKSLKYPVGDNKLYEEIKQLYREGNIDEAIALVDQVIHSWTELAKSIASVESAKMQADFSYEEASSYPLLSSDPQIYEDYKALLKHLDDEFVADSGIYDVKGKNQSAYFEFANKFSSYADEAYYLTNTGFIDHNLNKLKAFRAYQTILKNFDIRMINAKKKGDYKAYKRVVDALGTLFSTQSDLFSIFLIKVPDNKKTWFIWSSKKNREMKWKDEKEEVKSEADYAPIEHKIVQIKIGRRNIADGINKPLIVSKEDLSNGRLNIAFRITNAKDLKELRYSFDRGKTWKQKKADAVVNLSFSPKEGKKYYLDLILKDKHGREESISVLPYGLVYHKKGLKDAVIQALSDISEAYEREDLVAFSRLVSNRFVGGRQFLINGVRLDFDLFSNIQLKFFVRQIYERNDSVIVKAHWDRKHTVKKTGRQQRTSGDTTLYFIQEGAFLRLFNMRGNLIFATLSPQIASASGLPQSVVDRIRTAQRQRNPVQPGAGAVLEDGGVQEDTSISDSGTSAPLAVKQDTITFPISGPYPYVDFTSDALGTATGDFVIEINIMMDDTFLAQIQKISTSFSALTEAPSSGYSYSSGIIHTGDVFVFITKEGYYGKCQVVSFVDDGTNITITLKWAVQTDGSRNITTS